MPRSKLFALGLLDWDIAIQSRFTQVQQLFRFVRVAHVPACRPSAKCVSHQVQVMGAISPGIAEWLILFKDQGPDFSGKDGPVIFRQNQRHGVIRHAPQLLRQCEIEGSHQSSANPSRSGQNHATADQVLTGAVFISYPHAGDPAVAEKQAFHRGVQTDFIGRNKIIQKRSQSAPELVKGIQNHSEIRSQVSNVNLIGLGAVHSDAHRPDNAAAKLVAEVAASRRHVTLPANGAKELGPQVSVLFIGPDLPQEPCKPHNVAQRGVARHLNQRPPAACSVKSDDFAVAHLGGVQAKILEFVLPESGNKLPEQLIALAQILSPKVDPAVPKLKGPHASADGTVPLDDFRINAALPEKEGGGHSRSASTNHNPSVFVRHYAIP